jgi:hypothetical protein
MLGFCESGKSAAVFFSVFFQRHHRQMFRYASLMERSSV